MDKPVWEMFLYLRLREQREMIVSHNKHHCQVSKKSCTSWLIIETHVSTKDLACIVGTWEGRRTDRESSESAVSLQHQVLE